MKTKQFLLTSALLIAGALISCKKDNSDSNNNNNNNGANTDVSYTINGGTFKNQLITFNSNPNSTNSGADASQGYLKISIDDATSDDADSQHALTIGFEKAGTGTSSVYKPIPNATGDDKGAAVGFSLELPSYYLSRSTVNQKDTPGTVTITKFGAIGEPVEGTFEGTVMDIAGVKYTISGGRFKITRKG